MRRHPHPVVLIVLGSALLGSMLSAQPPPAAPEPSRPIDQGFGDHARVVAVEVPVHVTDRDGRPVRGLGRDEFLLFDDGELRPLSGFEVVDLEVLRVPSFAAATARQRLPLVARRHLLLLFDLSFTDPVAILRARDAARRWVLDSLHPTDLAAVMVFSLEMGPRLLLTFTPDRVQLARAIETLGDPRLLSAERPADPLRFAIDKPTASSADSELMALVEGVGDGSALDRSILDSLRLLGLELERSQKAIERGRIGSWARALGHLARQLDTIQGSKQVLYFSSGFDGSLLFGRAQAGDDPRVQRESLDRERGELWAVDSDNVYGNSMLQGQIDRMLEEFRRAGCVIQAIDTAGLGTASGNQGRAEAVGRDALFYLAESTGGQLFTHANDFAEPLDRALARTSLTYVLSFERTDLEADGRFHRLDIRLQPRRRGVDVAHRAGYYAPRQYAELHPLERQLLAAEALTEALPRDDLALGLLAVPFPDGEGAYVPVIVELDGASLLDAIDPGGTQRQLELYVYASDERGILRDFFTQMIRLDLAQVRPRLALAGLKTYGALRLGPGRHLLRVLLRDATDGRSAVATRSIDIPAWDGAGPKILAVFGRDGDGPSPKPWLLVRHEREGERDGAGVVYPFIADGQPYVPSAQLTWRPGEKRSVLVLAHGLPPGELKGWLAIHLAPDPTPEAEPLVRLSLSPIHRSGGGGGAGDPFETLWAEIDTPTLPPAEYRLRLVVEQPDGRRLEHSTGLAIQR